MFELLNQGWVGSLIGLLGLVVGSVGLVLYVKSRVGPRPTCQMRSLRLIGKEEQQLPADIDILFRKESVPRLTRTIVWFWNSGTETIKGNEIVREDPLRCVLDNGDRILTAHVAAATRSVNQVVVSVTPDKPHELLLSFDYLDPQDGARIDLLHTSKRRYPDVVGSIRGIPKGLKQFTAGPSAFDRAVYPVLRKKRLFLSIVLALGAVIFLSGLLPESWLAQVRELVKSNSIDDPASDVRGLRVALITVGLLYTLLPLAVMFSGRRRYPVRLDVERGDDSDTNRDAAP